VDLSAFQMVISAAIVLLMAGCILHETSAIIHGGQTNYILATVSLYVSLYNIFMSLLSLLGGNRESAPPTTCATGLIAA
jgi:modulator of FtsH protease